MLCLLAPLAPTVNTLNLGGNKMGGPIPPEILAFDKLTMLGLYEMRLEGAFVCIYANITNTQLSSRICLARQVRSRPSLGI